MAVERLDNDLETLGGPAGPEERDLSLPPHSIQAEEAVLGSILKNPASIVRVSDFLKPEDFYQQRNRHVFRAMLTLFTDGNPIDYHSAADSLQQQGAYEASGGLLYLSELNLATPSAAHIEHYGRIVERTSIMRQLIAKAQTIAEIAYRDNLAPEVALEKAEQLIYGIAEKRVTRDFRSLEDVLTDYMEQIEALQEGEATRYGIPTGYMDLDKLLGGFQRTDLIILAARTSVGKALALDTPIKTPDGWTTMGQVAVGDQVFDEQGLPCTVTFTTPVQHQRECYEVVFTDGERIVADADHQWSVFADNDRKNGERRRQRVLTTRAMSQKLRVSGRVRRLNFSIPVARPAQCPSIDLPLDPYVLGTWLGDGSSDCAVVTLGDAEIVDHLMAAGCQVRCRKTRGTPQYALGDVMGRATPRNPKLSYVAAANIRTRSAAGERGVALAAEYGVSKASVSLINSGVTWNGSAQDPGIQSTLRQLGLVGRKHIPELFQRASVDQRLALLQGLMDTDGTISVGGRAEYSSCSRFLAEGVYELVAGLGMCAWFRVGRARLNGRDVGPNYRVGFVPTDLSVFRLGRKTSRQRVLPERAAARQRSIREINPVPSVPVRCIQVDSPNHLYLAGRTCVPTHNTSFALNLAVNAAVKHNATVAIFSLEMSAEQLASRLLSMESGVDSPRIRSANLNEQESRKLDAAMNHLARAPIWVDDTPSIPIMELRSKARRLAAEHTLDMIVVDYLQLVASEGGESRVQELGQISRALKALARELRVPILALSQLSRAVEQRTPHIPQLSDLRESGALEQDADVVLFIYRDEKYNPDTDKKGVADIIVAKHRNGPTGQVQLLFLERTTKFLDLEVYRS
jgi:replicative DNA helicase